MSVSFFTYKSLYDPHSYLKERTLLDIKFFGWLDFSLNYSLLTALIIPLCCDAAFSLLLSWWGHNQETSIWIQSHCCPLWTINSLRHENVLISYIRMAGVDCWWGYEGQDGCQQPDSSSVLLWSSHLIVPLHLSHYFHPFFFKLTHLKNPSHTQAHTCLTAP